MSELFQAIWLSQKLAALFKLTIFSAPICTTNLIGILVNFFAIMLVGRLGEAELAASALATATYTTLMLIASTSLYAVSILISHEKHSAVNDLKKIAQIFKNGCWLALMLALPIALLLWYAEHFLSICGQDEALIAKTVSYFKFSALTIFPILLSTVCAQFFIGIGTPNFTLATSLLRLPFILIFSYGFILGEFGLPKLGLGGVMAATLAVQIVYCIGLLLNLYFNKCFSQYKLFYRFYKIDWYQIKGLFKIGSPIGLQYGGELFIMSLMTYFMGYYGSAALAASQIVSQYGLLVIMLLHGSAQGLSVLVSGAYSQNNRQQITEYLNAGMILIGILFGLLSIVYTHPKFLLMLFMNDASKTTPELSFYVTYFFLISTFSLTIDGIRIYLTSVLRGLHHTQYPMKIGLLSISLISLPVSCFMAFVIGWGPLGLSVGFISGFVVAAALLWKKLQNLLSQPTTFALSSA